MYSCVALALKLLTAFCPEVGPQQPNQIHPGWPSRAVLKALQVSSQLSSYRISTGYVINTYGPCPLLPGTASRIHMNAVIVTNRCC